MKHWKSLMITLLVVGLAACGGAAVPGGPHVPGEPPDGGDGGNGGDEAIASSRFFLFTGDDVRNTADPTIEVDADGGVHVLLPANAVGDAFYAYCPADCASQDAVSVAALPTVGTVINAMLTLDATGRPHAPLSTYLRVYYDTCEGDCRYDDAWTVSPVLEHGGGFEVSGEAFALDPQGRPRFLMHAYRSLYPSGEPELATYLVGCDAGCHDAGAWTRYLIDDTYSWTETTLRYTADGRARVATALGLPWSDGFALAYFECEAACEDGDSWVGADLGTAYADPLVSQMFPAISLALTAGGAPRLALLAANQAEGGAPALVYLECETGCTGDAWEGSLLIGGAGAQELGAGLDLALDPVGRPRVAYVAASSVLLAYCDEGCTGAGDGWELTAVELAADIPADEVIPYHNCTVAAWLLREPSLAIGPDGLPRVAYRADDVSAPGGPQDPTHPPCRAGADMKLARFAQLASY